MTIIPTWMTQQRPVLNLNFHIIALRITHQPAKQRCIQSLAPKPGASPKLKPSKRSPLITVCSLTPRFQILIISLKTCLRPLLQSNQARKPSIAHEERQQTPEFLFLHKCRATWVLATWLKAEGVISLEDSSPAASPHEATFRVFLGEVSAWSPS